MQSVIPMHIAGFVAAAVAAAVAVVASQQCGRAHLLAGIPVITAGSAKTHMEPRTVQGVKHPIVVIPHPMAIVIRLSLNKSQQPGSTAVTVSRSS